MSYIPSALRRLVEERADFYCEYCRLSVTLSFLPYEVDHVIAEKHGGGTDPDNLALSCLRCNRHKGTDLSSIDPITGSISLLFNPRTQVWNDHFRFEGRSIVGLTSEGRATIYLLQMNSHERIMEREYLAGRLTL